MIQIDIFMKIVLQKFIAESGYCSRRKAEELIRSGKIFVNGEKAYVGSRVGQEDEIKVGGQVLRRKEKIYIILNKPQGYVCTNRKFQGEKNVFDLLVDYKNGKLNEKLFVVGRLDKMSEGLVLLTNDGELAQQVTHPKHEHEKKYLVEVRNLKLKIKELINIFQRGVDIGEGDGVVKIKKIKHLSTVSQIQEKIKFEIILTEGKKRQIRRMFKIFGGEIVSLKRISIGKIEIGNLKSGEWKCIDFDNFR